MEGVVNDEPGEQEKTDNRLLAKAKSKPPRTALQAKIAATDMVQQNVESSESTQSLEFLQVILYHFKAFSKGERHGSIHLVSDNHSTIWIHNDQLL